MNKTSKKVIAVLLALLMVMGSIGAWFTSTDTKSDAYTIGQIEIEVVGDDNLYSAEKLTPNYEYTFTRSAKNIGINDAYVFMAVTLPCDEVYLHNADGVHTAADAALMQLFTYGTNGVAGVSSEWAPVTAGKFGNYDITTVGGQLVNNSGEHGALRINNTVTYIYAYVGDGDTLARLAPDAETAAIFDTMKFANVSDTDATHNIEKTAGQIATQVYAIQAQNVLETEYMTGNNADGSDVINAVWEVLNNALVRTNDTAVEAEKTAIPVTSIDKNGNNLNASSTVIEGEEKEDLLYSLEQSGLADADEVDLLIDVKSDDFDGMADTTFDVSDVAKEGDTVVILHYDEEKGEWEHVATETVDENLTVGGDFSSYSPVAFVVIPKDDVPDSTTPDVPEPEIPMPDAMQYTLIDGPTFNTTVKTAANNKSSNVRSISFGKYDVPGNVTTYDVSAAGDGSILMWNGGTSTKAKIYVTYVGEEDGVFVLNENASEMFKLFGKLEELNIADVYSHNTTNMSRMFQTACSSLPELDIKHFDTSKVTDMSYMFSNCGLTELDVSNFDTSNVTNMAGMFQSCSKLTALDVSNFDTSNATDVNSMFSGCSGLTSLDVSNISTDNVTDISNMFFGCTKLTSLDVSGFNTNNVTNMSAMFSNCYGLTSLDLSNFNTSNVTLMSRMFSGCSGLTALDLNKFNTASVTYMHDMFKDCSSLTSLNLSSFNTSSVLGMDNMFNGCAGLTSLNLGNFNTSCVTNMGYMFNGCTNLTALDLSNFNTSNVVFMNSMFSGCTNLASLDISNFNTTIVESMHQMFYGCSGLTSLDLSSFNTSNVINMISMFEQCTSLATIYANNWADLETASGSMFYDCTSLVGAVAYSEAAVGGSMANTSGYFTAKP